MFVFALFYTIRDPSSQKIGYFQGFFCGGGERMMRKAKNLVQMLPPESQRSPNPGQPNWTLLLKHLIYQRKPSEAIQLYKQLRHHRSFVLSLVPLAFKACALLKRLNSSKMLHAESYKLGVDPDFVIGTSMVNAYCKCGAIKCARKLFDEMPVRSVVTWNAMINGYMGDRDVGLAFELFERMGERSRVTWIEIIHGFARNGDMVTARRMFEEVPQEMRDVVTWTVMIDGYVENGEMEQARRVFENMPERNFYAWSVMTSGYCKIGDVSEAKLIFDRIPVKNLVNWNSMISGYAKNGFPFEALEAFDQMSEEGIKPDEISVASALSACAQLGQLESGRRIHKLVESKGLELNLFVSNALLDMYTKCGDLSRARTIFYSMTQRNCVCWNAIISGFAIQGQYREALEFFQKMEESSENPDDVSFLSVLSACAHGGFVEEGLEIFSKMDKYNVVATVKHYGCLVDLLARAGRLEDAFGLVKSMPVEPNDVVWGALLGACRVHSKVELAECVANDVRQAHHHDDSHFALVANIYAAADRWEKAERVRLIMRNKGIRKIAGGSSLMLC